MDGTATPWLDRELAGCSLSDKRLDRRPRQLVERMVGSIGASIPLACQDWATRRRPIASSQTTALEKRASSLVISNPRVAVSLQRQAPS